MCPPNVALIQGLVQLFTPTSNPLYMQLVRTTVFHHFAAVCDVHSSLHQAPQTGTCMIRIQRRTICIAYHCSQSLHHPISAYSLCWYEVHPSSLISILDLDEVKRSGSSKNRTFCFGLWVSFQISSWSV